MQVGVLGCVLGCVWVCVGVNIKGPPKVCVSKTGAARIGVTIGTRTL